MWRTKLCLQPGCGAVASQGTSFCAAHTGTNYQTESVRTRNVRTPWRLWYGRWPWTGANGLRAMTLARDPICKICSRKPSTVADHKAAHKGDWSLFVDADNLQGLCEPCHSAKTAREDGGFGNNRAASIP